ncbi:MAG TPA: DUF3240 domain-containing protein [Chromatiales bacterium]|nr:DUF3240 domain-containing protein [Chromatiales bacterium]
MPDNPEMLVTLVTPPELQDALIDWLLDRAETVSGFTSLAASGHGSSAASMTLAEQVAGYQRRTLFLIHLPAERTAGFLQALADAFAGGGVHWWVVPVAETGVV